MRILRYSNRQLRRGLNALASEHAKALNVIRYYKGEAESWRDKFFARDKEEGNDAGSAGNVVDGEQGGDQGSSPLNADATSAGLQRCSSGGDSGQDIRHAPCEA